MTDPLDVLREPDGPVAPDPAFAERLRARLERALELPRGVAVSTGISDSTVATRQPSCTKANINSSATPYFILFLSICQSTKPARMAKRTSSPVLCRFNFSMMCPRCASTV